MSNELAKKDEIDQAIFKLFDELDDEVITKELKGAISEHWVYQYIEQGKEVIGLSKVGIDQASILLTKQGNIIREDKIEYKQDPTNAEYFLFIAEVSQYALRTDGQEFLLKRKIGTKRQWTKMKRKDGKIVEDEFWFEKGSMKALRNATARLIDEDLKQKIIAIAKEQKRVYNIKEMQSQQQQQQKNEPVLKQSPEQAKVMRKFWAEFNSLVDYNKNKEEINNVIHEVLYANFGKNSLREANIDYGKLLMLLVEDERIIPYLKNKVNQAVLEDDIPF